MHRSKDLSSDISSFKISTPMSMASQSEYGVLTTTNLKASMKTTMQSKIKSDKKPKLNYYNTFDDYSSAPMDLKRTWLNKIKKKQEENIPTTNKQNKSFKNIVKTTKSISKLVY